ncbi:MAG: hypothetical protein R3E10_14955 [Gemmatimonadota bacterium]
MRQWIYGALFIALAALLIATGEDLGRHLDGLEHWIGGLGAWVFAAYAALFLVASSLLVVLISRVADRALEGTLAGGGQG